MPLRDERSNIYGVPLDDQFDEEFMDQERQLLEEDDGEIHNESNNQNNKCCSKLHIQPCNCSLPKCSRKTNIFFCVAILIIFSGVCVSLGYISVFVLSPSPVLDKSYHAFSIPNHEASINYESFKIAAENSRSSSGSKHSINSAIQHRLAKDRSKRSFHYYADLPQRMIQWKMQVIFLAQGEDENIFTRERLEFIHGIEQRITNHSQFKNFCYKNYGIDDPALDSIDRCSPLNSLMQYFYPTLDNNNNTHFDGLGSKLADINSTLKFAMSVSDHFYYFVDMKINSTHPKSRLLRTEVLFGSPIKGYKSPYVQREEQAEKFKEFVLSYIDMLRSASNDKVKVLYGGNEIFDFEVNAIFWNDVKLASISLAAIFVFILILTSFSLWLTIFGLTSILLCFPLAVFFYHTVFGVTAFGILNGVAAFVIIGIGIDDVFVFINIYRQSTNMEEIETRIRHTLFTAGRATFFTSFTTAAAFAANTASSIPAVHQFGLFMSLIVGCCWMTVVVVMPPALYIWGYGIQKWEERCLAKLCKKCRLKKISLPADIMEFVGGKKSNHTQQVSHNLQTVEYDDDDDDDVQLLSMDDPMEYYIERYGTDEDDEVLLIPDHRMYQQGTTPTEQDPVKESSLMQFLQAGMYHYVALPVIRFRRFIIGISVLIMVVSVVLITQLHPSTKPPEIFREDTNLQMLLDLKTSMGIIDDVSCYQCSAINDVPSNNHYHILPKPNRPRPATPAHHKADDKSIPWTTPPSTGPPVFEIPPQDKVVPVGRAVTFYCSVKGRPLPKISWEKNNLPVKQVHTAQRSTVLYQEGVLVFSSLKKSDTGSYTCVASNSVSEIRSTARLVVTDKEPSRHKTPTTTRQSPHQHTTTPQVGTMPTPKSVPDNFDICKTKDCTKAKDRPMLETGATVYVVFGISKLDRSGIQVGHVMQKDKGKVVLDPSFKRNFNFSRNSTEGLSQLCRICKKIAARTDLIKNGSAQCFPIDYTMELLLYSIPGCQDLPKPVTVYGRQAKAHVVGGVENTSITWWAFGFESTTSKDQSYFEAYKEYLKWEELIGSIKEDDSIAPYLKTVFQTSEFWPQVMMEVVAVNSAIYSLIFSMVICFVAVAIFTSHVTLLLIVLVTILEMICLVAGIFYLAGWEVGGVEAVSLSILVGSSVDYCVHLVEGFILAGKAVPDDLKNDYPGARQWRTKAAISHIGVSIFSSSMTTIMAAIPLTQTTILPFSKFGQILAINSSVSIVYCLTVCAAFLAFMGPSRFRSNWKSTLVMFIGTSVVIGLSALVLFVISKCGVFIPGPNGGALFPN